MEKSRAIYFDDSGQLPGTIQTIGDSFLFRVDVGEFAPEEIIVTSYNNQIDVHAEKLMEDGTVANTFSHQSRMPAEVDPMSVAFTLETSGILTVRANKAV